MKRKIIWSFALLACLCCLPSAKTKAQTKNAAIIPGEVWKDTDGNPINAHGGGLLYHEGGRCSAIFLNVNPSCLRAPD